jgi:enoyl-CoA hydratase/carnithine racemase
MQPDILIDYDHHREHRDHHGGDGAIALVTLSNPDKLNAINAAMWRRLKAVMNELSANDELRAVVIRGEGGNFAAGGDIEEFLTQRSTLEQAQQYHGEWVATALAAIADCRHPTIAAIRGACVGGGLEIAGQCDLRIAESSSRFGAPIMRLGFSMAPVELAGLLAVAGPATALEILLEGRLLSAAEALQKGLVTRVVEDGEVEAEALATARRIASGAPLVARAHKQLVRRLMSAATTLSPEEIQASFSYLETADYAEGMAAFLAKRPPEFRGK